MPDIITPDQYEAVDKVHVALNQMREADGFKFVDGVMEGLKEGIIALNNPDLTPDEVISVAEQDGERQAPSPDYEAEYYRGKYIGSLTAAYLLQKRDTDKDDGEQS